MTLNTFVYSFWYNQTKCGTERVKHLFDGTSVLNKLQIWSPCNDICHQNWTGKVRNLSTTWRL